MQNRPISLAKSPGNQLLKTTVNRSRRSNIFATLEDPIGPAIIAHETARFAHQQDAGRRIPRVKVILPETVHPPGSHPGKVECRRTETANPRNVRSNGAVDFRPFGTLSPPEMRNAGT